jgi:radical SAM protein with 4Fe4S-binding SPASM domain
VDCGIPQLRYGEFSQWIQKKAISGRIPIQGNVEVTARCNLNCKHCYINVPAHDKSALARELSSQQWYGIMGQLVDEGCLWLLLTGGEPFLRPDFFDIYTYAKQKGLLVTIFSNGTLITPPIADYLADWRPFSIEITLYGYTRETYEQVTGVPGSYDRCMRGIRLLIERDLPLKLKTMAFLINKHEIGEMKRFAEEELGVEFKFDAMINPRIDYSKKPLRLRLTPEEVVQLDLKDPKRMAEWKRFAEQFIGLAHSPECWNEAYHCGAGLNSFAIDPYGRLSACLLSFFESYDLRKGSFKEGWGTFLLNVRKKEINHLTKCTACELKALCGMCPANAELENQDSETPVDFLCQVAHLRARVLDIPIKAHGDCEYCTAQQPPRPLPVHSSR